MVTFIQGTLSYLRQRFEIFTESPGMVSSGNNWHVLSGYSYTPGPVHETQQERSLERRQVGILYADVAAYSRLTEQDEEGTHHRLVKCMEIMVACVEARQGRVVHTAGDAILAEFRGDEDALRCAIDVQLTARELNDRIPLYERVEFRIGVNYGDVIADNGEIYGNAVNLAARLEQLAERGGICVSRSVKCRLEDHPSFRFVAMGEQYLKNLSEPVEVFWIVIDSNLDDEIGHALMAGAPEEATA